MVRRKGTLAANKENDSATSAKDSATKKKTETCHCGDLKCNCSEIEEEDRCLQCSSCNDFVLLRCLGSDSQVVYDFIQSCTGLIYACPTCRAEALPIASAAGLAKVEAKVNCLVDLFRSDSAECASFSQGPDAHSLDPAEWPTLAAASENDSRAKYRMHSTIPSLTNAVELALEKREQKDCLVLSGVVDSNNEQRDIQQATGILKKLGVSSRPLKAFRMGRTGKKGQPRLMKVQLGSSHDRNRALMNTRTLADSQFSNVFVRPSLTWEERNHLKTLMKQRWQRNKEGDYCFIDWATLSLKTSKKSPNYVHVTQDLDSNDTDSSGNALRTADSLGN